MQKKEVINFLESYIKSYSDFPKQGILFRDINPIFQDTKAFNVLPLQLANTFKLFFNCGSI